jgi:hypothetical protein
MAAPQALARPLHFLPAGPREPRDRDLKKQTCRRIGRQAERSVAEHGCRVAHLDTAPELSESGCTVEVTLGAKRVIVCGAVGLTQYR